MTAIQKRSVVVVGCGKLGTPLIACLASVGHRVTGIDLNQQLVNNLESGLITWNEPGLSELLAQNREKIIFQNSYQGAFEDAEISFIIVPTPSTESGEFSNDYVLEAVTQIGSEISKRSIKEHMVVIVSTVMPGSTEGIIKKTLLEAACANSDEVHICYSPEFIALGSVIRNMQYPDLVLIGQETNEAGELLEEVSLSIVKNKPMVSRLSLNEAEIAKIAINSFVTTKISFSNQISEICEATPNSSAARVLEAIGNDSRIGRSYLAPGAAFGGPCFPRDNRAFDKYANGLGLRANLAVATDVVNARQTNRVIQIMKDLVEPGARILVVGLSYKPDTNVVEESPGLEFVKSALRSGYLVDAVDDFVTEDELKLNLRVHQPSHLEYFDYSLAVLFVPSKSYSSIPDKLSANTKLIDLWGHWVDSKQSEIYRLGNYLAKK